MDDKKWNDIRDNKPQQPCEIEIAEKAGYLSPLGLEWVTQIGESQTGVDV